MKTPEISFESPLDNENDELREKDAAVRSDYQERDIDDSEEDISLDDENSGDPSEEDAEEEENDPLTNDADGNGGYPDDARVETNS